MMSRGVDGLITSYKLNKKCPKHGSSRDGQDDVYDFVCKGIVPILILIEVIRDAVFPHPSG